MPSARRPRSSATLFLIAVAALSSGLACSLILNPRDDVARCSNTDDCPSTDDNRYQAVCKSDPAAGIDTTQVDQICVAEVKTNIGCNPDNFDPDSAYRSLVDSRVFNDYACTDTPGVRGCPPEAGVGCADGLVVNANGQCDTSEDSNDPSINLNTTDFDAQDVKDQFCKSFFCDDAFVCDTTSNNCVKCDPDLPFGEGGCGTVYTQGQPSCVYVLGDELEDECAGPDAQADDPLFGNCG
ncbi:MAG: hypothetical protein AAGA54_02045 [Myxococcota bacterium]